MAIVDIEIVSFPSYEMVDLKLYVNVYQRVCGMVMAL